MTGWCPAQGEWTPGATTEPAAEEGGWMRPPGQGRLLVVLVRRGGYAVAVVDGRDAELIRHKVGTRHVQGRTAAGGWSQQRFARRRGNQADALVEAVVGHTDRILSEVGAPVDALAVGGDRTLAAEVLDGCGTDLAGLPRREFWDLPDPRRKVLDETVRRALAVRVRVHNA